MGGHMVAICTGLVLLALAHIARQIKRTRRLIVSESQDAVDAITAQVSKGTAEVVAEVAAEVAALQAQIDAGQAPDLTALKAAAQALDDLNADAPVEEPPVEETPVV